MFSRDDSEPAYDALDVSYNRLSHQMHRYVETPGRDVPSNQSKLQRSRGSLLIGLNPIRQVYNLGRTFGLSGRLAYFFSAQENLRENRAGVCLFVIQVCRNEYKFLIAHQRELHRSRSDMVNIYSPGFRDG
jgi:hypothetical protein